jgi:long-subunit acyl-CoA synthetase (AMP-forming)
LRIAADGEVEIGGKLFLGYLGEAPRTGDWWPTGDLGRLEADGNLYVDGRKKHLLITSFGRNISPEWVETVLRGTPAIAQAVVFGDAQPFLSAVLWPVQEDIVDADADAAAVDAGLQTAVDAANESLPDYARIRHWVRARGAFTPETGLATPNGRPRREAVLQAHPEVAGPATN